MTIWPKYSRPPLMQAVIEFRLREALSTTYLDKLRERFARLKWKADQLVEFELQVQVGATATPIQRVAGYQFTSPKATEVILINKHIYSLTVLPPYPGWEAFLELFHKHHKTWRSVIGKKTIARIGCRYINRFDIPSNNGPVVHINDYMAFRTTEPDLLDEPVRGLSMQVNSGIKADDLRVNLLTAMVESPVMDHAGVVLDIDLFREGVDVPQDDADISTFLELVRLRRTEIFEKCITDEMRKVIS